MNKSIAGYILSGGKNTRMNGEKKLFLTYEGETFGQRIVKACSCFANIYLSVDQKEGYESLGLPMVEDRWQGIGPMGGICSGLLQCSEEALFVLACDMPMIDSQTIRRLLETYGSQQEEQKQIVIAEAEDGLHPLFGIYPKHILPTALEMIGEGNYRMMHLLKRVGYQTVRLDADQYAVTNVNTLEELKGLRENEG